jgi:hypothetical protein
MPCVAIIYKQKCQCFSFIKLRNRREKQILPRGYAVSGRGEEVEERYKRVNTVQILCKHVCKWKNDIS